MNVDEPLQSLCDDEPQVRVALAKQLMDMLGENQLPPQLRVGRECFVIQRSFAFSREA